MVTGPERARGTVGIGLIGCGQVARAVHLPILARLPETRLVAVADTDAGRLAEAGARVPHAAQLMDYVQLLAAVDVEAVIVCVPPALHAEATTAALQAGKHVYVEKPLAATLEEGARMCEAWRQSGRVGMIGFNYRFNALYQEARRLIASGCIGPVAGVRMVFTTAQQPLGWRRSRPDGGGVLLDLASHEIDLVRFLLDREVVEVLAEVRSRHSDGDTAALHLRLANGVGVQLFVAFGTVEEASMEVFGEAGKLELDRYRSWAVRVSGPWAGGLVRRALGTWRDLRGIPYALRRWCAPAREPSFAAALRYFAGAVRDEHRASPDLADGFQSLKVVLAAEHSARIRRAVALEVGGSGPFPLPADDPRQGHSYAGNAAGQPVADCTDGLPSLHRNEERSHEANR
jgi:predicted dehydrogenase